MPDQWEQIATSLRHRARRLVSLRGLALTGVMTVGLLWLGGLTDWMLQLDPPWLRGLLAVAIVVGIGLTIWKTLWRPLHVRLSDVDVARSIERRFPRWGDQLSSAAQFRDEHYAERLGSPALQQQIIAGVDERLQQINPDQVLDPEPTRRLALIAATICVLGLTLAIWQRSAAATALTRLALPFSDVQWPRTSELVFLNDDLQPLEQADQRTAAGEPFALYLENRLGALPEDVRLLLRLADGRREERSLQTTTMRDAGGRMRDVGIVSLTAHEGPIHFRAVGGDDEDMPWFALDVVPPPALTKISLTITPPAYMAAPQQQITSAGQIEALVGSRVEISARANTSLRNAALRREGHPPQPMTLTDGGRQVDTSFVIDDAGHRWYWFEIVDEHGLSPGNPPRYELRGLSDRKPNVFIDRPAADVTLTPDADLPLRIIARDDLGVKTLRLVHSRPGQGPAILPLVMATPMPTDETVEMVWSVSQLGLESGDRVTFHVEAVDAFDLPVADESTSGNPPNASTVPTENAPPAVPASQAARPAGEVGQIGLSAFRHIEILSSDDKRRELATRQLGVLDMLKRLQQQQARAAESTAGLRIQSELAEQLQEEDLDLLKQTELEQQQIREQLSDSQSGARREVERLRDELEQNRIDDPQMHEQLQRIDGELQLLTGDLLPVIEQSLARARKTAQSDGAIEAQTQQQLRQAEQAQSQALSLLEESTRQLGGWQRQFEITTALDEMIADQSSIQQQTQQIGRQTLTKRPEALPPQQQADLARLSDRQRRLASRLQELLEQGTEPPSDTDQADPESDAMRGALRELTKRRTAAHMHNAAESLRRNDIATTAQAQEQVLEDLRQFGDLLQAGGEEAAESLLSNLKQQVEEVETLRKQQAELLQQAGQVMQPTADPERQQQLQRLRKRQQKLANQVDELARQLRRQQQSSAQSAARAARRMRQAGQALEQEQREQTADAQREALDDLEQLAVELAERQQQVERELARQQIEELAGQLRGLAEQQEQLLGQTVSLDELQRDRGSWSRTLRRQLRELTDEQSGMVEGIDELRNGVSEFPVVELSLEQAAEPMRAAVKQLQQSDAGSATHELQRTARQRLFALVDVLEQSQQSTDMPASSGPPQAQPVQLSEQQQVPQLLGTQLRLLRHLQADVQQRTSVMTRLLQSGDVEADDVQDQRQQLARDQQRIAELTRTLLDQITELQQENEPQDQP